ncbi:unnamed protein product, partial [Dibothriocephalus latus]
RYCLGGVLRLSNKVTFTDVQVRGCCIFRPQHDFSPDSCELRLVNLNYTAASYAVAARPSSVRQLRTPRQESSNFTAFMRACADAHFEKSFSRSFISTPVVKPSPITASRTISASTPIQRRGGNLQAPSSATTAVRSLSTLLRGDLVSAASAATPCKLLAPETTPSSVSVTPKPFRTRTGLSRPRSSCQTLPLTPCSAASALSMATPAGSASRRTRLRASQEAVESIPPTVMSPGPANKEPVEQTPVRRATKQQEAPASPPSQSSPSFLGSSFTVEALDDLNFPAFSSSSLLVFVVTLCLPVVAVTSACTRFVDRQRRSQKRTPAKSLFESTAANLHFLLKHNLSLPIAHLLCARPRSPVANPSNSLVAAVLRKEQQLQMKASVLTLLRPFNR